MTEWLSDDKIHHKENGVNILRIVKQLHGTFVAMFSEKKKATKTINY